MFDILGTEFWDATKTLKFFSESYYSEGKQNSEEKSAKVGN